MTDAADTATEADMLPPYAREALDVVASSRSDADAGLTGAEAAERLARLGPNQITLDARRPARGHARTRG